MRQCRSGLEDEKIAACLRRDPSVASFDVREQVMERVYRIHKERRAKGSGVRRMTRKTFVIMTGIIVALTSLTGFAASRYFQIANEKGKVIIKAKPYQAEAERNRKYQYYQNKLSRKLGEYEPQIDKLRAQLCPGEIIAYYIDDDAINTLDTSGKAKFTYKPLTFQDYDTYISQLSENKRTKIVHPERLTDSIRFVEGSVHPDLMLSESAHDDFVKRKELGEQFEREAKNAKGDKKIFTKPMPWREGHLNIVYSDRQSSLRLHVDELSDSSTIQTYVLPDSKVEKIKLNGREVLLHDESNSKQTSYNKHKAIWFDEQNKYYYMLTDEKDSKLSNKEFVHALEALVLEQ